MRRYALFSALLGMMFAAVAPLSVSAAPAPTPSPTPLRGMHPIGRPTPQSYSLTCSISPQAGPTPTAVVFYPVPGTGGPDGTDETGKPIGTSGKSSCGWISRAYRAGEKTTLCGSPTSNFAGQIDVATSFFSGSATPVNLPVYNDGNACMVVTGEPTAAPAQRYPDLAVVCHTPLRPGSAPAASFYTEEGGAVSTTTELATLPVGSCASESAIALPVAAFCVANDQDTPYKNQLLDLEHDGFYRMIVHADPGCNIYESGTLTYFGQTYPKAKAKLPRQAPTPVPAATLTPLPAATLTPTPAPL